MKNIDCLNKKGVNIRKMFTSPLKLMLGTRKGASVFVGLTIKSTNHVVFGSLGSGMSFSSKASFLKSLQK